MKHTGLLLMICVVVTSLMMVLYGCDGGDGGDGEIPGPDIVDLSDIDILSEELVISTLTDSCALSVRIQNLTNQLLSLGLIYNAFDDSGVGIAFTPISGLLPANATESFEGLWIISGGGTIDDCGNINSFELDPSSVVVGG